MFPSRVLLWLSSLSCAVLATIINRRTALLCCKKSGPGDWFSKGRDITSHKMLNMTMYGAKITTKKQNALPLQMTCQPKESRHDVSLTMQPNISLTVCAPLSTVAYTWCTLHYVARKQYLVTILQLLHNQRRVMFRQFSNCAKNKGPFLQEKIMCMTMYTSKCVIHTTET